MKTRRRTERKAGRGKGRGRAERRGSVHVAFAWYTPEEWEQLRATADDPQALDDSYEEWLASAEEALSSLRARGIQAVKFQLDVSAAAEWALEEGRPFNSAARADYVALMSREKERRSS